LFPHALLDALDLLDRGRVFRLDTALEAAGTSHGRDTQRKKEHANWFVLSSQTLINTRDEISHRADGSRWRRGGGGDYSRESGGRTFTRYHPYNNNNTSTQPTRNDTEVVAEVVYNEEAERNTSIEGTSYHVHTQAWNCSCPAFAFAAFAGVAISGTSINGTGGLPTEAELDDGMEQYNDLNDRVKTLWQDHLQHTSLASLSFGGLAQSPISSGMRDEVIPPTCKHLLACVLAEICPGLFTVGRGDVNEFGGIREGRKGVVIRGDCEIEEVAAWAGGGVFV